MGDFPSPFDPKELKMASGVAVSEDVKIKYDEIKKKKTHRYCVFFIKDEKLIAVEKIAGRESSYEEFLSDIMACGPEDCRYGLYDFEYEHQCQGTSEKTRKEKLLLMSWCPDTDRIKMKWHQHHHYSTQLWPGVRCHSSEALKSLS